jgi:hypothetical protein
MIVDKKGHDLIILAQVKTKHIANVVKDMLLTIGGDVTGRIAFITDNHAAKFTQVFAVVNNRRGEFGIGAAGAGGEGEKEKS